MGWWLLIACAEAPLPPVAQPAEPVSTAAPPPAPSAPGPNPNPAVDAAPGPPPGWLPPRVTPPATPFVVGAVATEVAASWPIEAAVSMPGSYMIGGSTGMTHQGERVRGVVSVEGDKIRRINLLGAAGSCDRRREELVAAYGQPSTTTDAPTARVDQWLGSAYTIQMTAAGKQCGVDFRVR